MASSAAAAVAATALLTPPMSARSKLRRYRKLRKLGQASRASSRVSSAAGERTVRGRLGWEDEVDMHYRGDMEVEACLELSKFSGQPLCVMKHIDTSRRGKKAHDQALQEAKFLHELDHPNIINVWDYFSEGGSVFIVMEYAAGGDLADMVKIRKTQQHYMTEREVLLLVVQMVSALAHLHSRKIIHRDFKSPNVFLTSNGMVKLGDFGIARSLDNSLDHAETQVGTPFYYSPEVCKGEPYNHKSDVWSLGVVTYELCSLRRPFESGNIAHLATLIVSQEPKALHERYSTDLRRMVAAFLSKEPVSRPSMGSIMHLPWLTAPLHAASKLVEEGIQEAHAASSAATVGDSSDDESNDEVEEEEQERRRKIRARRHHKRNSSLFPASILHPPSQVDCAGCNKPIRGVCVEAGGERPLFHPHCFRCSQCDREISSGWVERNGDKGGRLCLSCDLAAKQEELLKQEQKEDEEEGEEEEDEEEVYEEDYEEYESGEEAGASEEEGGREAKEEEEEEEEEGKEEEEEAAVGGAGEDTSLALQLGGLLAGLPEEDEDDEDEDTWTCNSCSRQNPSSVEKEWREDGPRTFRRTGVDGAVAGVEEGVEEEEEDGGGGDAVSPTAREGEGGEGGKEAGGEEVSELKEWQCPMCTLLNSNRRACAACGYLSDALANLAKDRQAFLDYTERLEGILQRKRLVKQAQKVKHNLKKGKSRRATARSGAGGRAGPGERSAGEGTTRLKRGKRSPKGSPKSVATSRVRRSMGGASDGKGRVKKGSTVRRRSKAGEKMATAASPVASISPLGIKRDAKGYRIKGQGSPSLRSPPAGPGTSSSSSPTLSSPPSQTSPATTRLSRLGKTEVLSGKGLVPSNANAKDKMGKRFRF